MANYISTNTLITRYYAVLARSSHGFGVTDLHSDFEINILLLYLVDKCPHCLGVISYSWALFNNS